MSKEDRVIKVTVKDHTEPPKHSMAEKLKQMAVDGKEPQVIKEPIFLYSTLDYQEKLTYTNGEVVIVAPKSKNRVDKALIDVGSLHRGFKLHDT